MTPNLRKFLLTLHVAFSVGWFGAVVAFLALAVAGLTGRDAQMVRSTYTSMEVIARFVIVPLAIASLLSGLIESLGTPWGLFRHYWVLAKLVLTAFATIVLLKKMPLIALAARRAAEISSGAELRGAGKALAVHAAGGLAVLLVITALSVYKPWGLTVYGRRRLVRREETVGQTAGASTLPAGSLVVARSPSRGLTGYLAAGFAVVVVVVHLSLHLAGHGFHHHLHGIH